MCMDTRVHAHIHVRACVCVGILDAHSKSTVAVYIAMYVVDMRCFTHIHTDTCYALLLCHCLCVCVTVLPSLYMNIAHICQNAVVCDKYSTRHHDCATGNDACYHHVNSKSYINVYIKLRPRTFSSMNL